MQQEIINKSYDLEEPEEEDTGERNFNGFVAVVSFGLVPQEQVKKQYDTLNFVRECSVGRTGVNYSS